MSDLNDLNKPDGTSNYSTEAMQTIRGHITRLWKGDYTGMGNLVTGMLRWAITGTTTLSARLYQRNSSGVDVEVTMLSGVNIGGNAATATTSAACTGNAATATTAGSAPASDVYTWAKQSTKPSYAFSEIGTKPTTLSGYGITDAGGLGVGQTWQIVTRAYGVTYTNSTSKPIVVNISGFTSSGTYGAIYCRVDWALMSGQSVLVATNPDSGAGSGAGYFCGSIIIPPSSTYLFFANQGVTTGGLGCYELR